MVIVEGVIVGEEMVIVGRCDSGIRYTPSRYFERDRLYYHSRGNELEESHHLTLHVVQETFWHTCCTALRSGRLVHCEKEHAIVLNLKVLDSSITLK